MTKCEELKLLCENALGEYFNALNKGEKTLIDKKYDELLSCCKLLEIAKEEEIKLKLKQSF